MIRSNVVLEQYCCFCELWPNCHTPFFDKWVNAAGIWLSFVNIWRIASVFYISLFHCKKGRFQSSKDDIFWFVSIDFEQKFREMDFLKHYIDFTGFFNFFLYSEIGFTKNSTIFILIWKLREQYFVFTTK